MGAVAWARRRRSVSHPRSSNRTCGFPASGSPTGFVLRHTKQITDRKRHRAACSLSSPHDTAFSRTRMIVGVCRLIANHLHLAFFESIPEVRVLPSTGITRLQRSYYPVRLPPMTPPEATLRPLPSHQTGLPRLPEPPFRRAVPTTNGRRVGIRIVTFEACSGFTHVTARQIAQPPTGDLCHEAPTHAVTRTSRSSATGSIDNSPGGFFLH